MSRFEVKSNRSKSGASEDKKIRKRDEAIERNERYQSLSFEEKMERNSDKVRAKLKETQ